ncbi:MAG TPA: type II toxin-antitoxin system VapC family toxin [Rhizomicrobium sp.]
MVIYAESSALLAWLLGEPKAAVVANVLNGATTSVTSELTLIECDRAFHQGVAANRLTTAFAKKASSDLVATTASWAVMRFLPSIITRARQSFPNEPIRALDALHVASALQARQEHPQIALLSLDDRIRKVGASLGFEILPK